MAGILRGSIEHVFSQTTAGFCRDAFAAMVRFFDSNPQMVRIASNGGSTGAAGTVSLRLPGFTGDANQSGENAFGVWRWDKPNGSKIYILMQWGYSSNIGPAPGNPAVAAPAGGVALQFAMRTDGGNPWNGGTGNLGADTKNGTNVWVDGGSTLLVWPRANGPGGNGATIRQYMSGVNYTSFVGSRLHVMMDSDALWWAVDLSGNGGYDTVMYFGPYVPHSQIVLADPTAALVHLHVSNFDNIDWATSYAIGTTTGSTSAEGGAVVHTADGVRSFKTTFLAGLNGAIQAPNPYTSGYDVHDIYLRMEDAVSPVKNGLFGRIDPAMLALIPGIATHDTNVGKTRVALGSTGATFYKFWLPWNGVTVPGTGGSNTGIQF